VSAWLVARFVGSLFLDGATFSIWTTLILLHYSTELPPWFVALVGSVASGLGSVLQFVLLRWVLGARQPWMRRFAPSRERLAAALARYPSASFLTIAVARATPLPDAPVKLVAATINYPALLYLLAIVLGALPYYFVIALLGHEFPFPGWILAALAVAIPLVVIIERLIRGRRRRT